MFDPILHKEFIEQKAFVAENAESSDNFMEKTIAIINKNLSNSDFDINSLAKELNLSRSVLFRKFKELANVTPNEFIQIIRLKKSGELIQQSELTISEIAYMVGFNDARYFSTCFKKQFGKTPLNYRNG